MQAPLKNVSKRSYYDYDKSALLDTAKNVIPRAIASTQTFTNYFFRGRLDASLSFDNRYIIVQNVSDDSSVNAQSQLTFKQDQDPSLKKSFSLYYVNSNKVSTKIADYPLLDNIDLTVEGAITNNKYAIDIGSVLDIYNIQLGDNNKLILLFDGQIGDDVGKDDFDINARGMSVAFVKNYPYKKTSITESAIDFDDGWFRKGAIPFYIRNPAVFFGSNSPVDSDTVLDIVTGLQWQDNPEVETVLKPWLSKEVYSNVVQGELDDVSGDSAYSYCANLRLAGYADWRLPRMKELLTIVRYGPSDAIGFEYLNSNNGLWSVDIKSEIGGLLDETELGKNTRLARVINPRGAVEASLKRNLYGIRCVRNY